MGFAALCCAMRASLSPGRWQRVARPLTPLIGLEGSVWGGREGLLIWTLVLVIEPGAFSVWPEEEFLQTSRDFIDVR